ncbi:MAG: hypothetical protein E7596_03210 [Ruminococcaceae bacterium]|nr:hypothetical protein [Oscillospiraceae bacterium]
MKSTVLKRMICIVMAVMLALPVLSIVAFAQEDNAERYITKQPSSAYPSIEVSDQQGATYQWYVYDYAEEITEVTDQNAIGKYDSGYTENGWTGGATEPVTYFSIELEPGDILVVSDFFAGNFPYIVGETDIFPEYRMISENQIEFDIEVPDSYTLFINTDGGEKPTVNAQIKRKQKTKLEGETASTLTEYEIGKQYAVLVAYEDGTTLWSNMFEMEYAISSEPTEIDPTVKTNKDSDVQDYKWYFAQKGENEYAVIEEKKDPISAYVYYGTYEDGKWNGAEGYINLAFRASYGDVLKIKTPNDFEGDVGHYNSTEQFNRDENGIYYYELTESNFVDFEIFAETSIYNVEIYVERDGKTVSVVPDKNYNEEKKEIYPVQIEVGIYNGEKWETLNGALIFLLEVPFDNASLEIIAENAEECQVMRISDNTIIEAVDNKYSLNEDYFVVYVVSRDAETEIEAEFKLTNGESTYNIVNGAAIYDNENKTVCIEDINDGYYQDGAWHADGAYNEIDIELELYRGYILTVTPSKSFDGTVVLDVANADGLEIDLVLINGKYIFVSDDHYDVDLELENCENDFSAVITIQKSSLTELEGENEKTLGTLGDGYFYVRVEFEDETILRTNGFDVSKKICFDTNGGTAIENVITDKLTEIEKTTRKGFILDGWYTDSAFKNKVTLPFDVTGIVTLYAKWEKCDHAQSTSKPSCTENTECTACGGEYLAKGHSLKSSYIIESDSHSFECEVCGAKQNESEHTFTEWKTVKKSTNTLAGEAKRGCTVCGYSESKKLDVVGEVSCDTLGHTLQAGYTITKDSHYFECIVCRGEISKEAHSFTEWQTIEYETREESGKKARVCTKCGNTEYCEIEPATGLSTGAAVGIIIGSGAGLAAIAIAAAWLILKKKSLGA